MSIKPCQVVYKNPDHFLNLEYYKDARIFCDITIKVDDKRIEAHKIILASTIPYFKAMFCNDMAENKQHEVTMHDIDSEVVETVINYAYTGQITIDESNAYTIILAASFFSLGNVMEALDTTLLKSIFTPKNILSIRHIALTSNCPQLLKKSNIFIEQYFLEVAKTESFLDLSVEDINDLLSNDKLNVSSEQQVLEALMLWITHDIEDRKSYLPRLITRIRLRLISPEFLINFVMEEELMRTSLDCRKEIDEALGYNHSLGSIEYLDNKYTHQRSCELSTGCFFSLSVSEGKSTECILEKYNPLTNDSVELRPLPVCISRFGSTMYKNNYYVIGGYTGKNRLDTVYTYNCHENIWKSTSPLRKSCSTPAVAVLNDYIYRIGGRYETCSISEVERYCPVTGMWKTVSPMNTPRCSMQALPCQGSIYVMCGSREDNESMSTVERYDPRTDQWMVAKSASYPRHGYASILLGDRIYVFGGSNSILNGVTLCSASTYDIRMDTWIEMAPMNIGRFRPASISNLGKIWVIGGYTSIHATALKAISTVQIYDPLNDSWSCEIPLITCGGETHTEVIPVFQ